MARDWRREGINTRLMSGRRDSCESGRFAGSKNQGLGRCASAATRFIAFAPNLPFLFSVYKTARPVWLFSARCQPCLPTRVCGAPRLLRIGHRLRSRTVRTMKTDGAASSIYNHYNTRAANQAVFYQGRIKSQANRPSRRSELTASSESSHDVL